MDTAYSPDGLHPNASGNALLAAAFATRLRELFSHAEGAEKKPHAKSAEDAELESHAESAENAEPKPHAESAEKQP
jgi:hypothetical protein